MKKKKIILGILSVVVVAVGINYAKNQREVLNLDLASIANIEAIAGDENADDCPTGCLEKVGSGCWCYTWHPLYEEANWD